jgi:uncharacterized protein YegP (UPF0339 family)
VLWTLLTPVSCRDKVVSTARQPAGRQRGPGAKPVKITIRKSSAGQYWFTIVASNGQKLANSEQYMTKASAKGAAELIKSGAGAATIEDLA